MPTGVGVGSSMKVWGRPVRGFSVGAPSHAAQPLSCCSAPRQTSSHGATSPKRALPQARASWPETQACAGWPMTSSPAGSSRCNIAPLLPAFRVIEDVVEVRYHRGGVVVDHHDDAPRPRLCCGRFAPPRYRTTRYGTVCSRDERPEEG